MSDCDGLIDHLTVCYSVGEGGGEKDVIEAQVRVPSGEGVACFGMEAAVAVNVIGGQHDLDGFALDVAPAEPDEGANPARHAAHIEQFAGCEGVEIADEQVKAVLVLLDAFE